MAMTYSYFTGDGITADQLQLNVNLPDANGGNVTIAGTVLPVGGSAVTISQSITLPVAPGSGSVYWIIECHHNTGVCTLLQSTTGWPTTDPNNDAVFQDILISATTDPALDPSNQDL